LFYGKSLFLALPPPPSTPHNNEYRESRLYGTEKIADEPTTPAI
jgi:hypothetical protein